MTRPVNNRGLGKDLLMNHVSPPRPRVVLLDPLHHEAMHELGGRYDLVTQIRPPADRLPDLVRDADALIVRSGVTVTRSVIEAAPGLRVIARAGAGTDNIDLEAARLAGVMVFTVPGGSANAVAELAMGSTLALARHIATGDRQIRTNRWNRAALTGSELQGKIMGIIGYGSIGSRIAQLAKGFGMHVAVCVAQASPQRAAQLSADGVALQELPDLLARSDVICLALPLTARTRGLIGRGELEQMKRSALLVNVARGGIVVEQDLYEALQLSWIAGAATDVFAEEGKPTPLADLDNVVLTPHIGALTEEAQLRIGQAVISSLEDALGGRDVKNRVC
jgi:D-3-phosphoglycerate dehydrogenase / 2-oxoglutarate reductase